MTNAPSPPAYGPHVTVRMPQETLDALKEIAEKEHRTVSHEIRRLIDERIADYPKKKR